jgi:hypothetical protein
MRKIRTPFLWTFVSDLGKSKSATGGKEGGSDSIKEETKDGSVTITFVQN